MSENGSFGFLEMNKGIEHHEEESTSFPLDHFFLYFSLCCRLNCVNYLSFVPESFPHSILIMVVQKFAYTQPCVSVDKKLKWHSTYCRVHSEWGTQQRPELQSDTVDGQHLPNSNNAHSFANAIQCYFVAVDMDMGMNTTLHCMGRNCFQLSI